MNSRTAGIPKAIGGVALALGLSAAAWAAPVVDPREKGLAEARAGRWHLAVAPLEQVIRETPKAADAEVWRTLAMSYLRQARTGDAIGAADRGLKAIGDDALLLQTKSDALARMRRTDEAAEAARRAEKLFWKAGAPAGKTAVVPPFAGTWRVIAGPGDGTHTGLAARWAWDFARVDEAGLEQDPKARDKRRNESWFAWDQPVLAPADGEVVFVEAGVADNILAGTANDRFPLGNHLVIRHASGELSYLGHLKKGSVSVKAGDAVKAGDEVARCGNSGAIVQPQLHYALLSGWDPAVCVAGAFTLKAGGATIQPKKSQLVAGADAGMLAALGGAPGSSTLAASAISSTAIVVATEKKEKTRTKTGDTRASGGGGGGGIPAVAPPVPPGAIGGAAALGAAAGALSGLLKGGGDAPKPDAPGKPAETTPDTPSDAKPDQQPDTKGDQPSDAKADQPDPKGEKGNNAAQEGQEAGQQGDPGTDAPSQQASQTGQQNAGQGQQAGQQGQQAGQQAGQQGQQAGQQAGQQGQQAGQQAGQQGQQAGQQAGQKAGQAAKPAK